MNFSIKSYLTHLLGNPFKGRHVFQEEPILKLSKKPLAFRIALLIPVFFLYGLGISLCLNANIGLSPWDIFHQALSKITRLSFGQVNMLVGAILVLVNFGFQEKIGLATILNAFFIGFFLDLIKKYIPFLPKGTNLVGGIFLMLLGLSLIAIATVIYLNIGLGSGPRDGLMLVIFRHSPLSIGMARNLMEFTVTVLGVLLGGSFGLGTILTFSLIGPLITLAYRLFQCDPHDVAHQYLFAKN